jgi:hypothetical protein
VLHSTVPGPSVFVDCRADEAYDESGPHHRWDTGVLFDNVVVHGTTEPGHRTAGSLEAHNQGMTDGHGWSGANIVFWNCTADKIDVGKPPTAQNWVIGATTTVAPAPTGSGFIESSNHPVEPHSLYHAQLGDRLARLYAVSGLVRVTATPVPGRGADFSVTITNVSNERIPGPVLIVFTSLPRGVALASVSGYTVAGDPFVAASLTGLAPGQSVMAVLRFTAPLTSQGIAAEILAGLPQPLPPPNPSLTAEMAQAPTGTVHLVSLDSALRMWGDALETPAW